MHSFILSLWDGECIASTVVHRRKCSQQRSTVDDVCWPHLPTFGMPWPIFVSPELRVQKMNRVNPTKPSLGVIYHPYDYGEPFCQIWSSYIFTRYDRTMRNAKCIKLGDFGVYGSLHVIDDVTIRQNAYNVLSHSIKSYLLCCTIIETHKVICRKSQILTYPPPAFGYCNATLITTLLN